MTRLILGFGMAFASFVLVLLAVSLVALAHWALDHRGRRIKRIRPLDTSRAGP